MTYVITKYVHRDLQPVAEKAGHWLSEFFALKDVKKVVIDINPDLVDCWGEGVGWFKSSDLHPHEAKILKLDSKKAKNELGWSSRWTLKIALNETALWYKQWQKGNDMSSFTINQIKKYETYP